MSLKVGDEVFARIYWGGSRWREIAFEGFSTITQVDSSAYKIADCSVYCLKNTKTLHPDTIRLVTKLEKALK